MLNKLNYKLITKNSLLVLLFVTSFANAQEIDSTQIKNEILDSLFIYEIEGSKSYEKVLHAEPLYIDLIRDLGARKGEKEWNVGLGMIDNRRYDEYIALVEYEWAPIDRVGLEIELPFSFYYPTEANSVTPNSKLNSLKVAGQYSFLVKEKIKTSMALGYIHEFELTDFKTFDKNTNYSGNAYNPFLIIAKRWRQNFHTLLYTGPKFIQYFNIPNSITTQWQINSNMHYMIKGTRNFIGIEVNKTLQNNDFDMTLRPQMRVEIADNFLIGIVTGIPIKRENERLSLFVRLIYEPGHKTKKH